MAQQGDVLLVQTDDDGNIESINGVITMTCGFETAVYLSMFAGAGWWGDLEETDPDFQYPSETEQLIESIPAVPANLRRIEEAALRDLAWLKNKKVASLVEAFATMPGVDMVKLRVLIEARGERLEFSFVENWQCSATAANTALPPPPVSTATTIPPDEPGVPVALASVISRQLGTTVAFDVTVLGTGANTGILAVIGIKDSAENFPTGVTIDGVEGTELYRESFFSSTTESFVVYYWDDGQHPGTGTFNLTATNPSAVGRISISILELNDVIQNSGQVISSIVTDTVVDIPTSTLLNTVIPNESGKLGVAFFAAASTGFSDMSFAESANLANENFADSTNGFLATWEDDEIATSSESYDVTYTKTGGNEVDATIFGAFALNGVAGPPPVPTWGEVGNYGSVNNERFISKIAINSVTGDRWVGSVSGDNTIVLAAGTSTVWVDQGWNVANQVLGIAVYPTTGDVWVSTGGNMFKRTGGVGTWDNTPGTGYTGGSHDRITLDTTNGDLYSFSNFSQELWKQDGGTTVWNIVSTGGPIGINFSGLAINSSNGELWATSDGDNTVYKNTTGGVGGNAVWVAVGTYPDTAPNDIAVDTTSGDIWTINLSNPGKVFVLEGGAAPFVDKGFTAPFAAAIAFDISTGNAWAGAWEVSAPGSMYEFSLP